MGTSCIAVDGPYFGSEAVNTLASGHDSNEAHEGRGASEVVNTGADSVFDETVVCRNSARTEGDTSKNYLLGYTIIEEVDAST